MVAFLLTTPQSNTLNNLRNNKAYLNPNERQRNGYGLLLDVCAQKWTSVNKKKEYLCYLRSTNANMSTFASTFSIFSQCFYFSVSRSFPVSKRKKCTVTAAFVRVIHAYILISLSSSYPVRPKLMLQTIKDGRRWKDGRKDTRLLHK